MKPCDGTPAERCALPYVEGSLPENESEQFEEHFFECGVCLAHLQTLQAVGAGLNRLPAAAIPEVSRKRIVLGWPAMTWAIGSAVAALLVIGAFVYRGGGRDRQPAQVAQNVAPAPNAATTAATAPAPAPAPAVNAKQLADLALPAFVAANLRGEADEPRFQDGMKAYSRGDCADAVPALEEVPAESRDARAAQFYKGVCQMHSGNLTAAAATLRALADAGDSPQQEAAYYYLAQVALARNDAAGAHRLLQRTIALRGDLEREASAQDRKVIEIAGRDRQNEAHNAKND